MSSDIYGLYWFGLGIFQWLPYRSRWFSPLLPQPVLQQGVSTTSSTTGASDASFHNFFNYRCFDGSFHYFFYYRFFSKGFHYFFHYGCLDGSFHYFFHNRFFSKGFHYFSTTGASMGASTTSSATGSSARASTTSSAIGSSERASVLPALQEREQFPRDQPEFQLRS